MKLTVKLFVGFVIAGAGLLALGAVPHAHAPWEQVAVWVGLCLLSELFWVRTPSGDSVQSLAATAKLSTVLILDPAAALLVILGSTVVGNLVFRRSKWYRALYNGGQLTLAGAATALAYHSLGGAPLIDALGLPHLERFHAVSATVADRGFLFAYLAGGLSYITVNNALMTVLMALMTGRGMWTLWRENCLYPQEVQSSLTSILLSPLFVLLYGAVGLAGLFLLLAALALVHQANRRYMALEAARDTLLASARRGAYGELAGEIGGDLARIHQELKTRTRSLRAAAVYAESAAVQRGVRIIDRNVHHMENLVSGLAQGREDAVPEVTDLNELVRSTIAFVKPQNRFDGVHFSFLPDPLLPPLRVDPGKIQQILINFFNNAADASRGAGRTLPRIQVTTVWARNRIRLQVDDNGPGIPPDHLDKVFEPQFTFGKEGGHGLGLAAVDRIVQQHGGTVTARNRPGGGASFRVELPRSVAVRAA